MTTEVLEAPLATAQAAWLRGADAKRAWVITVGPHTNVDAVRNVYDVLYRLTGVQPPDGEKRTKPNCCDDGGTAPALLDDGIEPLIARSANLGRRRGR